MKVAISRAVLHYEQSLFFLWSVEQNVRHANGHARDCWHETGEALISRVSRLPLACIALTKSEEKERLLAV